MELKKRDCNIKIRIEPLGAYLMEVVFDFGDSKLEYMPSSAMNGQFGDFVSALYTLYTEGCDGHNDWHQKEYHSNGITEYVLQQRKSYGMRKVPVWRSRCTRK